MKRNNLFKRAVNVMADTKNLQCSIQTNYFVDDPIDRMEGIELVYYPKAIPEKFVKIEIPCSFINGKFLLGDFTEFWIAGNEILEANFTNAEFTTLFKLIELIYKQINESNPFKNWKAQFCENSSIIIIC